MYEAWSLPWLKDLVAVIIPAIQAVVVMITAWIAVRGINAWREQTVGKRKVEVAEATLTNFYDARRAIEWARFPGGYGHEGSSRSRVEGESEEEAQQRDAYFVPVERLHAQRELFAKLETQRHLFHAYFGNESAQPFDQIKEIHGRIVVAAGMLIRMYRDRAWDRADLVAAREKREAVIHLGEPDDEIARAVDQAVKDIEAICRPILEGRRG